MTTTVWLRIASVISLLFAAGHTVGGLQEWSPMGNNAVLQSMKMVRFDTMGASRSYFDFFVGFGWSISVALAMQGILLWQLATLARTQAAAVRPMIVVFAVASAVSGVIAWRYILPVPALFSLVLVASLVVAWMTLRLNTI
jgi:hypothetical protein